MPWYVLLIDYTGVGCYKDTEYRAIPTLEDTDSVLDGGVFFYQRRQNAIVKCAVAARKRGFPAFALQDGGWCAASSEALETFNKYGNSSDCQNDGRGGPFANNVYVFQDEANSKVFSVVYTIKNTTTSIQLKLKRPFLMFIIPGSICNKNDYAKLTNGFCSTTEEAHQETRTEPKVK